MLNRHRARVSGDSDVFSPEEIWAVVRAAAADTDGTIDLTAPFTGLRRGELLGLPWRRIDFEASTIRVRANHPALPARGPMNGVRSRGSCSTMTGR